MVRLNFLNDIQRERQRERETERQRERDRERETEREKERERVPAELLPVFFLKKTFLIFFMLMGLWFGKTLALLKDSRPMVQPS